MATLRISHNYLEKMQSEAKALVEGASALNTLFAQEETRLEREHEVSILHTVRSSIMEQLQQLSEAEASASCGHSQARAVLFVAELAATAIVSLRNRAPAIRDYLLRKATDKKEPFGLVAICIGPKGLPCDAKAISVSQLARESNRPEPEVVNGLYQDGYLLLSEEVFPSLIGKLLADLREGKLHLPIPRDRLAHIMGLSRPESNIKIVLNE